MVVIDPMPHAMFPVAQVAIRSITWARQPPYKYSNGEVEPDITADPTLILATSYSGTMYFADIRELQAYPAFRARGQQMVRTSMIGALKFFAEIFHIAWSTHRMSAEYSCQSTITF